MTPPGAQPRDQAHHDDAELLALARKGDRAAAERLVERHRERLFAAAVGLLRNHEDARDLSQEAFLRFLKTLDRFDIRRPVYPWLYRILRNLCLDHLERHGPSRRVSLDALLEDDHVPFEAGDAIATGPATDVREDLHRHEMALHLKDAIEELKPEFREIIIMKHFQDMPYKDIAEALDIPMGTVMSRLFHARKALAALMQRHRT